MLGLRCLEDMLVEMPRRPERWREDGPAQSFGGHQVRGMAELREAGVRQSLEDQPLGKIPGQGLGK